jgi:uncharacterized protein YjiS (DUF1127 family)
MTANFSSTVHGGSAAIRTVASMLSRLVGNWADRRVVHALSDLDDHLLADIGLTRADIDWALREPVSSRPSAALNRLGRERREGRNRRAA